MRALALAALMTTIAAPALAQTAAPAATTPAAAAAADKVRCKRYTETGSLAKVRKECHTEAEWRRLAADARRDAQDQMDQKMGGSNGPGL